jgi:hypothetical protein
MTAPITPSLPSAEVRRQSRGLLINGLWLVCALCAALLAAAAGQHVMDRLLTEQNTPRHECAPYPDC